MSQNEGASNGDGSYVVVARRYRPRAFDELVGQDHVGKALKNAIETSRVGHAYLFTGARGVGKTSTARIFAKALNAPGGPTANPDATNDVSLAIDSGEDVDVIEIDGASNRGIDEIRSLRANVGVRPSRSRFKIYIIDEVHMLTPAAFNALLKTLEEPPEHVKFIFCTTDPEKIPITVLSRCQRFDFAPVEVSKIVGRLTEIIAAEGAEADEEALELIARRAAGSMRDSQSLLEQVLSFSDGKLTADSVHSMLGTADETRLHALATAMAERNSAAVIQQIDEAIDAGVDAGRLAEQLLGYFRDLMAITVGCDASLMRHSSASMRDDLHAIGQQWGLQTVLAVIGLIDQTLVRIRHSVYARVLLEATAIQICSLPDLQNLADLASAAGSATSGGSAKSNTRAAAQKKKLATSVSASDAKMASPTGGTQSNGSVGLTGAETASATAVSVKEDIATAGAGESDSTGRDSTKADSEGSILEDASLSDPAPGDPASADSIESEVEATPATRELGEKRELTDSQAMEFWKQSLAQMDEITGSLAKNVEAVRSPSAGTIELTFPAESGLAMRRCETPEHIGNLSSALSQVSGMPVSISLVAGAAKQKFVAAEPVSKGPSRMQRMKEIEKNELICACTEMLGAELDRIERPR